MHVAYTMGRSIQGYRRGWCSCQIQDSHVGFMDPHILQLERSAPTPTNEARTCVCQVMASRCWWATSSAWVGGLPALTSQTPLVKLRTARQQCIAGALPSGMGEAGFDVHPEQLLMAETEVYGLISGPSWLRQSLVADFEDHGYVKNP